MAKRLTTNQKIYLQQEKRIKRIMRDLVRYGFEFDPDFNPIPSRPRVITAKRIAEIKSITPETLRQKAIKVPSWYPARKRPPKKKQPPSLAPIILNNIRQMIAQWEPYEGWTDYFKEVKRKDKNILSNILEGAVKQEGEVVVAQRLEDRATEVNELVEFVLYSSGGKGGRQETQFRLQRFSEIVWGRKASLLESKYLTAAQETLDFEEEIDI